MLGVQCAVCSVQCSLCIVQFAVWRVQCAVCSVQYAVESAQCSVKKSVSTMRRLGPVDGETVSRPRTGSTLCCTL